MNDDRTEPATYRRRRKARTEEGRVAKSGELVSSLILLAVLVAIPPLAPGLGEKATQFFVSTVRDAGRAAADPDALSGLVSAALVRVGLMAAPLLGVVLLVALATNIAQVGWVVSFQPLSPKLTRLNPISGMSRFFSGRQVVELLKNALKLVVVVWVGWAYVSTHKEDLFALSVADPREIAPQIGGWAHGMALRMVATLCLIAALDYAYQRWQFEKSLRMTKQEVKDEFKETEGNPQTKSRIRRKQREVARKRMLKEVPLATVVITNPTHFAVALRYEQGQAGAPRVVAKGQDLVALRIREIAEEHRVPIVENPPLARSLHKSVEIGDEIPPAMYRAVAEVLALIWRLDRGRAAAGRG